ncbi:MAG TPA: TonB-dependent receptor [Sphingomicrobium sp.]|nr:TonB-dependent receptor [Sphingomicrobium sp.]
MFVQPPATEIVVTASRIPQKKSKTAASSTVIDRKTIERLGDPQIASFIRLTPSAAVEVSGPAGSFTEVRIRGAEGNHSLLFIDGIRANDPAAGDAPRFELLNADIVSRLEVVRGPQSALWGSDAIGGVIAVNGVPEASPGYSGGGEAGSFGFGRANASASMVSDGSSLAAAAGWQRATGIDSFNGRGDRDGFDNFAARLRGAWDVAPSVELGVAAFDLAGHSEFDGFDPVTGVHADTLDNTRNRLAAGRAWASFGSNQSGFSGTIAASLLGSSNRNFLADEEINRTSGTRWNGEGQLQYRFDTGAITNTGIVALEHETEHFHARDTVFGGASDQDRARTHNSITAEWRSELAPIVVDVALRHDMFSSFKDATTVRASALADIGDGFSVAGSYSEGIAPPTFFDLFGFFPGSFVGNPSLKPESSRGFEASIRYRKGAFNAALTAYEQQLHNEIVDLFDPTTFLSSTVNRSAISHRSGIEAELGWSISDRFRVSANYAFLHATQPDASELGQVREVRRPKHSGSIAADGSAGRFTYGASIAYVGKRSDTDFDVFPAAPVTLHAYWLAGARLGYALRPGIELFARGSNLLNQHFEDVFGSRTEGRAVYAGVRFSSGAGPRSSR